MAAASLHECTQASLKTWQEDIVKLFQNAKDRYPDVVWEVGEDVDDDENATPDIEEVWGHKAIVYARAPPSFQSRYFQFRPSNTTSLSLTLSDSFSRSPSPSRNPTPQPTGQGITRLRTAISTTLFSNELEYLYTGQGFGEAFQFLFDEDGAGGIGETDSAEMRIDKLRRDLVFMWRSRLYSDVKIALSNEHEPSTAVFSTHKFILVSRSSYFAKLLSASSSNASKEETQILTLPSPPHTPASLHFTLGYLYTGTLSFSHRTYDLSTALSVLLTSSPSYLNLLSLHVEIRSRIVIEMAHGLFHAFLPFAEYDSLLNRGGTGGCKCRQCARRIPRILSFALQPTLQDAILERGARRALVGLFGDGWCTQEFAELDPKIRESVIRGVRKRMWKEFEGSSGNGAVKGKGLFPLLFAAETALAGKLEQVLGYNGKNQDDEILDGGLPVNAHKPWATTVRNDILTARKSIDECLAECVEDCLSPPSTTASFFIPNAPDLESSSQLGGEEPEKEAEGLNELHLLLLRSPHTPSYTDALHLQHILSSLLRGLSHSNAPVVYQTLVSNVLLLPSVGDPEQSMQEFGALAGERRALLGETNYVRIQVEEARVEVMKWIKGRWRRVRDMGGFLLKGNTISVPSARTGDNHSLPPMKGSGEKDVEEREGKMELWAVQEISDYIQIPLDDLLVAPTTPVSAQPSSQSLYPVKSGSDDASSVISARSGVSARSTAPSLKSAAPSFRSGVSSRSGALSPAGRRNGALSPTGGSLTGSARSGALSPTSRTRALSPAMRVSTLSKNLPPAAQKRVVSSSASSVRSLRSTTSVSTTTTTRKSTRETVAKVDKDNLGVRGPVGERPDSKFTEVEEDKTVGIVVPDVVVGDADMQDDARSTSPSPSTSTSVSPRPSPSKSGHGVLTPKASMASLSSNHSTQYNHKSSARSSSTSISPKQRRGSSHSTASVASTIRRAHAAAVKSGSTASKALPSSGKRPLSSASITTSTTASSVSGEYRTASASSGPMNTSTPGSASTSNSQRKRTTSASSARSVSGVSIRSVGGASVRSVSSPRMARKSSAASTTTSASSRPPSVAASIRSKKEVAPPLPPLKKKGSSDTIKTIGGTVTRATASSAAKAAPKITPSPRKVTIPKTPEEPRDPPLHLNGATLGIGIPCIVQVALPPPLSSSVVNGSKMAGRKKFKALAKYIGQVEGEDGSWVGVEVPSASFAFSASTAPSPNSNTDVEMSDSGISIPPSRIKGPKNPGWHDGTYQGIRYFTLSAPTASSSNKKEQWGDADETPAGGYYLSSHKKFASAGMGTVRKRVEMEVGGTVGRNHKRLKTQTTSGAAEKRGLFVRPQQVLYVVDAIDGDDEL